MLLKGHLTLYIIAEETLVVGGGDLVEVSYGVHRVSLMDSTRFYSISYMADDPEDVSY